MKIILYLLFGEIFEIVNFEVVNGVKVRIYCKRYFLCFVFEYSVCDLLYKLLLVC